MLIGKISRVNCKVKKKYRGEMDLMTGEKRKKAFVLYLLSAVARAVITSEREGGVGGGRGGEWMMKDDA